jgi:methionyl-tRNA synthetase
VEDWFVKLYDGQDGKQLVMPYDVPANEFMNLEGRKISGSRNWAVWGLDFLTRYDPDPLRYYLTVNMPESKDTDWDWDDFIRRNNDVLVATWGNLANRVLSFAYKHWDGHVPDPGELRPEDAAILEQVESGFDSVADSLNAVRLRDALRTATGLASAVNRYLDKVAPWFEIKEDRPAAARSIYTSLKAIDSLKILLAPFLPFSSEQLHHYLGYDQSLFGLQTIQTVEDNLGTHAVLRYIPGEGSGRWQPSQLQPGQALRKPGPLFKKLDPDLAQEERSRLGN